MASDPKNILNPLDNLAAHESVRLLRAVAEEETGLSTIARSGINAHCVSRGHSHKAGGNTESLAVRPAKAFTVRRGAEELPAGRFVHCYGNCGFNGSVSDYLLSVGPEGAAERFWTPEKVASVKSALENNAPIELGWLEWKRNQGIESKGVTARESQIAVITNASQQSIARFKEAELDLKKPVTADLIAQVCEVRKWDPIVVEQLCKEGVLGLSKSTDYPNDVKLMFGYRGIFESDGSPIRLIKCRLLRRGVDHAPTSRSTFLNPLADAAPIADFTSPTASFQTAPVVSLMEGEPDGISWRSMRPTDGIIPVGNHRAYGRLLDALPTMRVGGRRFIYCIDADRDALGCWKKKNPVTDFVVMQKLQQAGANVSLWVCPKSKSSTFDSKDVNDFLKMAGGKRDPLEYAVRVDADDVENLTAAMAKAGLPLPEERRAEVVKLFDSCVAGKTPVPGLTMGQQLQPAVEV